MKERAQDAAIVAARFGIWMITRIYLSLLFIVLISCQNEKVKISQRIFSNLSPNDCSCCFSISEEKPIGIHQVYYKVVQKNGGYIQYTGIVDEKNTRFIVPVGLYQAGKTEGFRFREGLGGVRSYEDKWGYIDTNGVKITDLKYDFAGDFHNGRAVVGLKGKYGYIDTYGKQVVPLKYFAAGFFSGKVAPVMVKKKSKWRLIDLNGKLLPNLEFDEIDFQGGPSNTVFPFKSNGKWGFVDNAGITVISTKYDHVGTYRNPILNNYPEYIWAVDVSKDGKWGLVDYLGKEIVALKYDSIQRDSTSKVANVATNSISDGPSKSFDNMLWGRIDEFGNELIPITNHFKPFIYNP